MKITMTGDVAKAEFTKNKYPFMYFEIYDQTYGIEIFSGPDVKMYKGPWSKEKFNIKEYPINEKTVNLILSKYSKFLIPEIFKQAK